ncbi:MAG TPA: META domain-containing protein [Methanolinea sp.]|nr:META domain-containing protein [Methanolinea sp.]
MKLILHWMIACILLAIVASGCTEMSSPRATPPPSTEQVVTPFPTPTPRTDGALLGTWYLKAMTGPGGSSPVQTISPQMDATFTGQGVVSGFAGCNHYSGQYTLTGEVLQGGLGIGVGPVVATLMYCTETSDIEARYLNHLQNAASYSITGDTLTLTDNAGSALVFQRTAYGPTAVPRGL